MDLSVCLCSFEGVCPWVLFDGFAMVRKTGHCQICNG